MNTIDYYQSTIAPRGSDLYYATRKIPAAKRMELLCFFAFAKKITDVIDECSDHGVARLKLQWWHQQIDNMYIGTAEHPAAIAFSHVCHEKSISIEKLQALVYGQLYLLDNLQCESIDTQITLSQHSQGALSDLINCISESQNSMEFTKRIGIFHGLADIIISLRQSLLKDRLYLASEDLQKNHLSVSTLQDLNHTPELQQVLLQTANRARSYYHQALQALPKSEKKSQRPALLRAKLIYHLLNEIEKDGFRVLDHQVQLTPLRKLFLTWY